MILYKIYLMQLPRPGLHSSGSYSTSISLLTWACGFCEGARAKKAIPADPWSPPVADCRALSWGKSLMSNATPSLLSLLRPWLPSCPFDSAPCPWMLEPREVEKLLPNKDTPWGDAAKQTNGSVNHACDNEFQKWAPTCSFTPCLPASKRTTNSSCPYLQYIDYTPPEARKQSPFNWRRHF